MLTFSINKIFSLNIYKTVILNFHYFPIKTACKFPVLVYKNVSLVKCKGSIILNTPAKVGLLQIGPQKIGTLDHKHNKSIWEVEGEIVLNGKANIGSGSRICVGPKATLRLGDNFNISGNSSIICQKEITFGLNCLLSWDILIMDTDFHKILDLQNNIINPANSIHIGNHVWIGCRSTILKGVQIADHSVVAAGAVITKTLPDAHSIYGGNNLKLKSDIDWEG